MVYVIHAYCVKNKATIPFKNPKNTFIAFFLNFCYLCNTLLKNITQNKNFMKKILTVLVMFMLAIMAFASDKTTTVFTLDHQMSTSCETKIKNNLRYEKGVSAIDVSLKDNTIKVTYAPEKTDAEKLLKAFKKIGFNAMVVNGETPVAPAKGHCGGCGSQKGEHKCSHGNGGGCCHGKK